MAQIIPMPVRQKLECSECGAHGEGSCACGAPYVPAGQRAAEAVAKSPEKSDRAIAKEIGVSDFTVRKARKSTASNLAVEARTGRDGRKRKLPKQKQRKASSDACDYDWSNIKISDFGNPSKAYRAQAEHYRREAEHLATAYPLLSVDLKYITKTEIQAVRHVAQTWSDLADKLVRLVTEGQ